MVEKKAEPVEQAMRQPTDEELHLAAERVARIFWQTQDEMGSTGGGLSWDELSDQRRAVLTATFEQLAMTHIIALNLDSVAPQA